MLEQRDYIDLEHKVAKWMEEHRGPLSYPSFYAGNLEKENGSFEIYVKKNEMLLDADKKALSCLFGKASFIEVPYSLNELHVFYEMLCEKIDSHTSINGFWISEKENAVMISYDGNLELSKQSIKELVTLPPFVKFIEGRIQEEFTVAAGCQITTAVNGASGSCGVPATDLATGNAGFISVFHNALPAFAANQNVLFGNNAGQVCGSIISSLHGGNVDAGFVLENNAFSSSNYTTLGTHITGVDRFRFIHAAVTRYGGITGNTSGRIVSFHFSSVWQGTTIHNQYMCDYISNPGDSGSPVLCDGKLISLHRCGNAVPGIHQAGSCRYEEIAAALHIAWDPTK